MDRDAYWAGRLDSMGGGDYYRHVKALMAEIGLPPDLDGGRLGFTVVAGTFVLRLHGGLDYEHVIEGPGPSPRDAAANYLTTFETWVRQRAESGQ